MTAGERQRAPEPHGAPGEKSAGQAHEQTHLHSHGHAHRGAHRDTGGTIRRRLTRLLALPAVVILVLLGVVAAGQVEAYRASTATSRSVTLDLAVQDLVQELQIERGLTAGLLGGNASLRAETGPARQRVDRQRAAVRRLVSSGGAVERRVRDALSQLDGLPAVRAATDASSAGRAATFAFFTDRIAALTGVDLGLDRSTDQELRRGVATLAALGDVKESAAQERAFLNGVFSAGGFAPGEFVRFAQMRAAKQAALARFTQAATPSQRTAENYVLDTGAARVTNYFEQVALDAADGRHMVVNPQSWWSALTTVLDNMRQMQRHVGSQIQARAHALQQAATQRIAVLVAVVLLCLAGSIYLAVMASLSITRPLAALAGEADSVAADRLPEAVGRVQAGDLDAPAQPPPPVRVPARASAEIRSVAAALDRVQTTAYSLATEQAILRRSTTESLANLGRRNQNLLRRQIGFITTLEREELDPSGLANLFELDHLATRMRRNAASLLVLVGASSPRQWSSPVAVADVIRAAVSEVEEYRRVSLRRVDDAFVSGTVVGAVAHLLSELIENGLTFSPPDCDVEIQGRRLADGYLIAITDQGIGMTTDELAGANERLRGGGDFVATPTRFLGHFVVGQLARETSIHVELLPSPVTGVTARVTLPASALATPTSIDSHVAADEAPLSRAGVTVQARTTTEPLALTRAGEEAIRVARMPEFTPPARRAALAATGTEPVERTQNGLRKRIPRDQRIGAPTVPAGQAASSLSVHRGPALDGSPAEVRARLTALRAGMQRGLDERAASIAASSVAAAASSVTGSAAAPAGTSPAASTPTRAPTPPATPPSIPPSVPPSAGTGTDTPPGPAASPPSEATE